MSNPFRRYELLIPLRFNDGRPVRNRLAGKTVIELRRHFSALQCAIIAALAIICGDLPADDSPAVKPKRAFALPQTDPRADCLAASPDGSLLVAGTGSGRIVIWRIESGERVASIAAHDSYLTGLAFSSNGKLLASSGHDGAVKLWRMPASELVASFMAPKSGERTRTPYSPAFSSDATRLVTGDFRGVCVWDVVKGNRLDDLPARDGVLPRGPVRFSPDGRILATGGAAGEGLFQTKQLLIWKWPERRLAHIVRPEIGDISEPVIFDTAGNLLLAAGSTGIALVDVSRGTVFKIRDTTRIGLPILPSGFAHGDRLIIGTMFSRVAVWDPAELRPLPAYPIVSSDSEVVVLPDGLHFVTGVGGSQRELHLMHVAQLFSSEPRLKDGEPVADWTVGDPQDATGLVARWKGQELPQVPGAEVLELYLTFAVDGSWMRSVKQRTEGKLVTAEVRGVYRIDCDNLLLASEDMKSVAIPFQIGGGQLTLGVGEKRGVFRRVENRNNAPDLP